MTLQPYDPKLLEFLHALAASPKFLRAQELAKVKVAGKQQSSRTIMRWLKYLTEKHYFAYYPRPKYELLGLKSITVVLAGVKDFAEIDVVPYKTYVMQGFDVSKAEGRIYASYLIPVEHLGAFEKFWQEAQKAGRISNYELMVCRQRRTYYAQFHKIVKANGELDFGACEDAPAADESFADTLSVNSGIINNPLVVPLMLEHLKDFKSSHKIWRAMKAKLGEAAWAYLDFKARYSRQDGLAIASIQKVLKKLLANFDTFFIQPLVEYGPLYNKKNTINLAIFAQLESAESLRALLTAASKKSVYCSVCSVAGSGRDFLIDLVTAPGELSYILSCLEANCKKRSVLLLDYGCVPEFRNSRVWLKNKYYELFEPQSCKWHFEVEKYIGALEQSARVTSS